MFFAMSLITVPGLDSTGVSLLNLDGGAMGKKACKNLFETDLRKERSSYMDGDDLRWTVDMSTGDKFGAEKLLPVGFPVQLFDQPAAPAAPTAPKMNRGGSYKVPPLKKRLETIEEDKPEYEKPGRPDYLLRSKSLPTQRRFMDRNGLGLSRLPSYRPGQEGGHLVEEGGFRAEDEGDSAGVGTYFAGDGTYHAGENGYGMSMSGPIFSTPSEYKYTRRSHVRSRLSITRMREVIRHSRLRGALTHIFARMRPCSRRSH